MMIQPYWSGERGEPYRGREENRRKSANSDEEKRCLYVRKLKIIL
jgi:hypothetical protein